MKTIMTAGLAFLLLGAAPLRKPCAGAMLNPAVSANQKYRIDVGPQGMMLTERWATWTETDNGVGREIAKWSGTQLQFKQPYHAWFFIPPTGNGFLAFCPFPENPLFAFYDRSGKRVLTYRASEILDPREMHQENTGQTQRCRTLGPCAINDYRFAQDPVLSRDGWFVEMKAFATQRPIRFFLPLGVPVSPPAERKLLEFLRPDPAGKGEIEALVKDLDDADIGVREKAAAALQARGSGVVRPLHHVLANPPSREVKERVAQILESLKPWSAVLENRDLLESLLHYPSDEVKKAVLELAK